MTTDNQPQVAASAPSADTIWTVGTLTLIAIAAMIAIVLICWGSYLKRQRKSAQREILERQEDRHDGAAPPPADVAPLDKPDRSGVSPPVAPAPPPIASHDAPVPATAPTPAVSAAITQAAPARDKDGDDLTLLKGVGPKLAARLTELGITRFEQIATLTPETAEALDVQLGSFQGRMARDRWIDQARYLARNDRAGFEGEFGKL